MAISDGGNSENVIRVTRYAKTVGTKVVDITGYDGERKNGFFLESSPQLI